ncbi:hypothetical protein E2F47_18530 [Mycobacterium eburneum]|nr:hypothetical protein [Mycobacterium eburneum]TDH50177.1 hypothetical protein E2F47_18530 [Mycobacterium eburneum]
MASFTSILSPHATTVDETGMPDCCADLYLDQVIRTVTTGHTDDGLENFFYAPLHDVSTVNYRHDVFRDLERDEVRRPIENFVAGMRTMRQRMHQSAHLWHPLQQHGWFVYAVEAYCSALKILRDDLAQATLTSDGLRDFVTHVCHYVDSDTFQMLVADTQNVQAELHQVRYAVHIQGLRVHVEKYDAQPDYSAQVAATFERFVTATAKDYRVRLPDFPDMNHVEEQVLECVARLYPQVFSLLKAFCTDNTNFVEPVIDRFDREIHFYLSYLAFMRLFVAGPR